MTRLARRGKCLRYLAYDENFLCACFKLLNTIPTRSPYLVQKRKRLRSSTAGSSKLLSTGSGIFQGACPALQRDHSCGSLWRAFPGPKLRSCAPPVTDGVWADDGMYSLKNNLRMCFDLSRYRCPPNQYKCRSCLFLVA